MVVSIPIEFVGNWWEWVSQSAREIDRENENRVQKSVWVFEKKSKEIASNCNWFRYVSFIHFVWNTWITQTTTNWSVNGKCQKLFNFFRKKRVENRNTHWCAWVSGRPSDVFVYKSFYLKLYIGRVVVVDVAATETITRQYPMHLCGVCVRQWLVVSASLSVRIVDSSDNKFDWKQKRIATGRGETEHTQTRK